MGLFNDVWEQTKAEQEEKQKRKKIERLAKAYKLSFEEAALHVLNVLVHQLQHKRKVLVLVKLC
ncbi:hypothetical protein [Clostridium paraputrificum]|uniref:hypothetical protein n=1 Tax=Clostridium paraputrificum TaxID=29363 RepID=UPI0034A28D27